MHLIFFNTKGGVSKSTLCEYTSSELQRLGYKVNVENTDQQLHVNLIDDTDADYFLYDTAGAFTADNVELLQAASNADALIIVPMNTGKNDLKELEFLLSKLDEYGVKDKTRFVFSKTRPNSKALAMRRATLSEHGMSAVSWIMPMLDDFGEQRDTKRTRSEIKTFLDEVIL